MEEIIEQQEMSLKFIKNILYREEVIKMVVYGEGGSE